MLPIDFVLSLYIIARNKSISRINAYAVSEITLGTATCPFEFSSSTIIQKFRKYSRRARACVCVWMCATYPAKMEEEKSGEQQSLNGTFYRESFQPLDRRSKARTRDSTRILNGREKCKWWLEECKRNSIRTAIEEKEKARAKQAKLPTSPLNIYLVRRDIRDRFSRLPDIGCLSIDCNSRCSVSSKFIDFPWASLSSDMRWTTTAACRWMAENRVGTAHKFSVNESGFHSAKKGTTANWRHANGNFVSIRFVVQYVSPHFIRIDWRVVECPQTGSLRRSQTKLWMCIQVTAPVWLICSYRSSCCVFMCVWSLNLTARTNIRPFSDIMNPSHFTIFFWRAIVFYSRRFTSEIYNNYVESHEISNISKD